jgi:DNA-binding transcriptional ArsR family regulator
MNIPDRQYSRMAIEMTDALSRTFQALADPTRRAILAKLAACDADVSQLMKPFGFAQPTISKHLKVLERAGLVSQGREAQRRPRRLVAAPLKDVDRWLEPYRRSWEEQFASLDRYLIGLQRKGKGRARRTK